MSDWVEEWINVKCKRCGSEGRIGGMQMAVAGKTGQKVTLVKIDCLLQLIVFQTGQEGRYIQRIIAGRVELQR